MERFKQLLKKVFFLPLLPTVIIAVLSFAFMIFSLSTQINGPVAYVSYTVSAYALVLVCTAMTRLGDYIQMVREQADGHPIVQRLMQVPIIKRYFQDIRFRTEISLYQGLFINLLYISIKMFSGIYYRSFWFISLAIYYILLAIMRLLLVRQGKKRTGRTHVEEEIHRYRMCGIVLLMINQALAGIVIFMVHQNRGFDYPGLLIYLMALYAFYAVISAVINLVKFRKHGSPVMSAANAIRFVAALVSVLSLETAMLARFGGDDESFRAIMTGATGGGVCAIVIGTAIYMIWKSAGQLKKLQFSNS